MNSAEMEKKYPLNMAIADTVEKLLKYSLITLEKKEELTDKRIDENGNTSLAYADIENIEAPDTFESVILYLQNKGDFTTEEAKKLITEVNEENSPFRQEQLHPYFWCDGYGQSFYADDELGFGRLSRRTMTFLSFGADKGEWHLEFVLACKDLKAQKYDIEEAKEVLINITGKLTRNDIQQLKYAYRNDRFEMSYRPR